MKRWQLLLAAVVALALVGGAVVLGLPGLSPQTRAHPDHPRHTRRHRRQGAHAGRAGSAPFDDAGGADRRRPAADPDAGAGRRRREERRRHHRVRSRRAAVQPAAGRIRARGGRTGNRQDCKPTRRCRPPPTSSRCCTRSTKCGAPRSTSAATSSSGRIEAEKNNIKLEESARALAQLQDDVKTHAASSQGRPGGARREAQQGADRGRLRAQEHRQHDRARAARRPGRHQGQPGRLRRLRLPGHDACPSTGRATRCSPAAPSPRSSTSPRWRSRRRSPRPIGRRSKAARPAKVQIEALPTAPLTGASKGIGGLAQNMFWEPQTTRQFDAAFALERPSAALQPGMTARVIVEGEHAQGRHAPAAPGALREGRQARRLRPRRHAVQARAREGRARHREPRRACRTSTPTSTSRWSTRRPARPGNKPGGPSGRCREAAR